ncbi:hypothetical protein [Nocardia arthritidis]|uniref:Uncharacterized protein n=1 Tax=Nocardia arthritidis TaxID=228602 RepID=A0A6G9YC77_9NOCA|nr:hypothetical protein [Nocardia arthritidis]QIS10740.1 hypothetical protein F5544_14265 [Nocardia arthritidis]
MDLKAEKSRWDYLKGEAEAGRLLLDPDVAKDCRAACDKQIELYQKLRTDLNAMAVVTGLGRFDCADELAKMLGAKAIGGDGDVDSALQAHIEVVTLMRDTIQKSIDKLQAQDEQNAQGFKQT